MADFLANLSQRVLGNAPVLRPPSRIYGGSVPVLSNPLQSVHTEQEGFAAEAGLVQTEMDSAARHHGGVAVEGGAGRKRTSVDSVASTVKNQASASDKPAQKAVHPPESIPTHQPLPPLPVRDSHVGPTLVPVEDWQHEKPFGSSKSTEFSVQTGGQEDAGSLGGTTPEKPSATPTEQAITSKAQRSGNAKDHRSAQVKERHSAVRQADVMRESITERGERTTSEPNTQQTLLPPRASVPSAPITDRGEWSTEDRSEFELHRDRRAVRQAADGKSITSSGQNSTASFEQLLVPNKPTTSQRAELTEFSVRGEGSSENIAEQSEHVPNRKHHLLVPRRVNPESSVQGEKSQVNSSPLSRTPEVQAPVQSTRTINVTIGRVDVRATPEPRKVEYAPQPKRENQNGPSNMSLDDYLKRYNERNG